MLQNSLKLKNLRKVKKVYQVKVNVLLRKYSFMLAYVYSFIKPTEIPKALTFLCHSLTNLAREISSFIGTVHISVYKETTLKSLSHLRVF